MDTLKGVREFCEVNRSLKTRWHRVAIFALKVHIHELENALLALDERPARKKDYLYTNFRNAFFELREACAKFGLYVPDFKPEDVAALLR